MLVGLFSGVMAPMASAASTEYGNPITSGGTQDLGTSSSKARLTFLRVLDDNYTVDKIELNIVKPVGAVGYPDLTVGIFAKQADKAAPTGDALVTGTIPAASIPENTGAAAAIVVDVTDTAIPKGDYVVVITYLGNNDGTKKYLWFSAAGFSQNINDNNYNTLFNSNDGVTWPGSPAKGYEGYGCGMKVTGQIGTAAAEQLIVDYSFNVTPPGGTIGQIGNAAFTRYNYVEFAQDTVVNTVDVLLTKFAPSGATNAWSDVRLSIYPSASGHVPTGAAIKSVVVPAANITGAVFSVEVNQTLTAGGYAIAITPITGSTAGTDNAYFWPRRNGATGDNDGGYTNQEGTAWTLQALARHWMKIHHTPSGGSASTIDYSVPIKGSGFGTGTNDEMERAQVFVPAISGKLTAVSLIPNANVVPNTSGHVLTDLVVNIYECNNETDQIPTMLLGTVIVSKADLALNGGPHRVDLSGANILLTAGKYYAMGYSQRYLAVNGDAVNEHYLFPTASLTSNPGNAKKFFKKNAGGWVAEALGTGWMQAYLVPQTSTVIDFSHGNTGGGLGAGHTDEQWRFQTFTADQTGTLESVDVFLNRHYISSQPYRLPLRDLVVAVYDVNASGVPVGGPIKRVVVPIANLPFSAETGGAGGLIHVNLDCGGIVSGTRYAVAITQNADPLPRNGGGDNVEGDYFKWPAASVLAAAGEVAGKMNTAGSWQAESVGTFWLKVKLNDQVQATPVPRTIELTPAGPLTMPVGTTQAIAAVVKDQFGEVMTGQTIAWSSSNSAVATVAGGVITAVARGTATIRAECGSVMQTLFVTTYESIPNKIGGAPNISLDMGGTATLDYNVIDEMKDIRAQDKASITFEVLTPGVISLSGATVTTLAPGAAQVLVKCGELKKYININVYETSETLVTPTAGMVITSNVKFAPGVYTLSSGLVIGADNITIDGNGATIRYAGTPSYNGTPKYGVSSVGFDNVTLKNLNVTNFNTGLNITDAEGWTIEYCDLSNNYTDPS